MVINKIDMDNAKEEFIDSIGTSNIKCADIEIKHGYGNIDRELMGTTRVHATLKVGESGKEFEAFLDAIDIEYNAGFGTQQLYGVVWMNDGTWYTRGEYDGSEWWEYHEVPIIPEQLKRD